jgi:pantothenate synthetase
VVDEELMATINGLAEEEHALELSSRDGPLSETERERLEHLEVSLDQCYDLLRQRRARRAAGLDPDAAQARGPGVVEHYEQ